MVFLRWQSIVDYCVLVTALYLLLRWSREVQALRIALGLLVIRVASMLARHLGLVTTGWILDAATLVVLVVVLVVFQSELRQAISRLDFAMRLVGRRAPPLLPTLQAISQAAFSLAQARRGALVVIARRDPVSEFVSGGVPLGGRVSLEILEAVFRKVSPVHDGATVVEGDNIARVGAILPLTQRQNIPKSFGTRHRAAMGLAERCDALVVTVSEERGEVTLMQGHDIERVGSPEELLESLKGTGGPASVPRRRPFDLLFGNARLKLAAVGLATLYWTVSFLPIGTSIRAVLVPVEFANLPAGMEIESSQRRPWRFVCGQALGYLTRLILRESWRDSI